jgi:hypothetical protein
VVPLLARGRDDRDGAARWRSARTGARIDDRYLFCVFSLCAAVAPAGVVRP